MNDRDAHREARSNLLYALNLTALLKAVYFIAGQYKGSTNSIFFNSLRNSALHSFLHRAFATFEDWPDQYYNFLEWRRHQKKSKYNHTGLVKEFGSFYRGLYQRLTSRDFVFMREKFEEHVSAKLDEGECIYEPYKFKRNLLFKNKYISMTEAVRRLRTTTEHLDQQINSGRLKALVSFKCKNRIIMINTASLEQLKVELQQILTLTDAVDLIGIKAQAVLELVRLKCFEAVGGPIVDGSNEYKFHRKVIEEFLSRLRGKVMPLADLNERHRITFTTALWMLIRCEYRAGQMVQAILNEEISCYADNLGLPLSNYLFSKKQVLEYAQRLRRIKRGGDFFIKDAMAPLGFKATQPISVLIRKGIIKAKKRKGDGYFQWVISQESIDLFKSRYVLPANLAKGLGTSGMFLTEMLMARGIKPICGPNTDESKQYVFRRSDLEDVNLTDLVSTFKLNNKRRNKKCIWIDESRTVEILNINIKALKDLIENGILDPSKTIQQDGRTEYFFNLFIVERLRDLRLDYVKLISISKAAKMVGETHIKFLINWVQPGYLKVMAHNSNKRYLLLSGVKDLIKLRRRALTTGEAANILGIGGRAVLGLVKSGTLKLISVCNENRVGLNLYRRSDVEKIKKR